MRLESGSAAARARELAWIALPFLAYLALLRRLWFDAPIGDDFFAILDVTMRLQDARSPGEWLQLLFSQHNEHRIVPTRLAVWLMAEVLGQVNFRFIALIGNLGLAAILFVLWLEFRDRVGAMLVAAAGFLLCQMTYYEGALLSMAACSNIGVLAFAVASFHFALRPGTGNAAAGLVLGLLATVSQANGLFALPVAAVACAILGPRRRAWVYAAVAIVAWALYMGSYQHPSYHASPLAALGRPVETLHLFVIIVGGLAPGPLLATAFGVVMLATIAWLAFGGFWRRRPAIAACVAFILLSAAAGAVARVGFGVFWASRYAVNSSCLAAIVFLLLAERRTWTAFPARAIVLVAAAIASLSLSWLVWPQAMAYSFRGRLLARPVPDSPQVRLADRYFGVNFPNDDIARDFLSRAEARKLYGPREVPVFGAELRASQAPPFPGRQGGNLDSLEVAGARVVVTGWSDLSATLRGRTFTAHSPETPRASSLTIVGRTDMAVGAGRPDLLFSGFRWEGQYDSEEQARRAASSLCLLVQAPGYPPSALPHNSACGAVPGEPKR